MTLKQFRKNITKYSEHGQNIRNKVSYSRKTGQD